MKQAASIQDKEDFPLDSMHSAWLPEVRDDKQLKLAARLLIFLLPSAITSQ